MRNSFGAWAVAAALALASSGAGAAPRVFFVAPDGDDNALGTQSQPFRTLEKARDTIRAIKSGPGGLPAGGVTVRLRGGTYYRAAPFELSPADSGAKDKPIVYEGERGESVTISGGRKLALKWALWKNGIYQAEVPKEDGKLLSFDQLFVNGARQHMARYPNHDSKVKPFGGVAADAIGPERVKTWANPAGGFVHGLHAADWGSKHYGITGKDAEGKLAMVGGEQINRGSALHAQKRFVENIFEELDAEGEWYFDKAGSVLYFKPASATDLGKAVVEVAGLKQLVVIRGAMDNPARFITFRNVIFTHTARTFMETSEPLLRSDWKIFRGGAVFIEGAEDCAVEDCFFKDVGGNAFFVSNYARNVNATGCKITGAGASAVCFVGDPGAVRSAALRYEDAVALEKLDRAEGPRNANYPKGCRAHDNLIHGIGVFEKQSTGVEISMAEEITVSHNSIYDVPRAGINICDGTWGGHVLEYNDVFDTVQETGDHGSFNSWGRDRFWHPDRRTMDALAEKEPGLILLDARKTTIIRNNRFRCDHGWDIDLDDGSSNYHIYNNVCLNGGLKFREGFHRTAENNVLVNNSFHPHVWFRNSGDKFVRNVVFTGYYPIGMPEKWGDEVDYSLFVSSVDLAAGRAQGRDAHSVSGADPLFVAPEKMDYRVKEGSPALALGFQNFPMDSFGVSKPSLRAEARTPAVPTPAASSAAPARSGERRSWLGAAIKDLTGQGEVSATGMFQETGVYLIEAPEGSGAARLGLRKGDVLLKIDGQPMRGSSDLLGRWRSIPTGKTVTLDVWRNQAAQAVQVVKPAANQP